MNNIYSMFKLRSSLNNYLIIIKIIYLLIFSLLFNLLIINSSYSSSNNSNIDYYDSYYNSLGNNSVFNGFSINSSIGLLNGLTVGVGYSFNKYGSIHNLGIVNYFITNIGIRLEYSNLSPINSVISNRLSKYNLIKNNNIGSSSNYISGSTKSILVDFYPFSNFYYLRNLRLVTGYYIGDIELSFNYFNNKTDETFLTMDGRKYSLDNMVNSHLLLETKYKNKIKGPYLGMGIDLPVSSNFNLFIDGGVVLTDKKPIIDSYINGDGQISFKENIYDIYGNFLYEDEQVFNPDGNRYDNNDLNEFLTSITNYYKKYLKLIDTRYYPIIKLGMKYSF